MIHAMKPNPNLTTPPADDASHVSGKPTPGVSSAGALLAAQQSKGYRRLKGNEMVSRGDFVVHELRGFEPWEGPGGFRADSFRTPIYRRPVGRSIVSKNERSPMAHPAHELLAPKAIL
jgi:hypothetical protein